MRLFIIGLVVFLTGCAAGPTAERRIFSGQWTIPQSIGTDTYLIEGFNTQDALNGGNSHCQKMGRQFAMLQITPHTSSLRATVTFRCN